MSVQAEIVIEAIDLSLESYPVAEENIHFKTKLSISSDCLFFSSVSFPINVENIYLNRILSSFLCFAFKTGPVFAFTVFMVAFLKLNLLPCNA